MSNYFDLKNQLTELNDALDNETNEETRKDIEWHITEIRDEIDNYDLSDDDLFECEECHKVFDIENSVKDSKKGKMICEHCYA